MAPSSGPQSVGALPHGAWGGHPSHPDRGMEDVNAGPVACSDECSDAQMPRSTRVPRLDNVCRSQIGEQVDEDRLENRLKGL